MTRSWKGATCAGVLWLGLAAAPAHASLLWAWSYGGGGISASGTLTTTDVADGLGFYTITGITGQRNGVAITGLQPAGTAIPGNEPFGVDNLLSASGPQLTGNGFGYATAAGHYANPFYADFLPVPSVLEFFSAPPFAPGVLGAEDSELPVAFTASLVAVPEPAGPALVATALAAMGLLRRQSVSLLRAPGTSARSAPRTSCSPASA